MKEEQTDIVKSLVNECLEHSAPCKAQLSSAEMILNGEIQPWAEDQAGSMHHLPPTSLVQFQQCVKIRARSLQKTEFSL